VHFTELVIWASRCENTALPVIVYGCDAWSLTLRGEHWLGVYGHMVLRKIFGSKSEEVADCGRFHNEKLRVMYLCLNVTGAVESWGMR
jgi:hypothetical protein